MSYLSIDYVVFTALLLLVYYLFSPIGNGKIQWTVLLVGSCLFYYSWTKDIRTLLVFLIPVIISYLTGLFLATDRSKRTKKLMAGFGVSLVVLPLLCFKIQGFFPNNSFLTQDSVVVPVGISFYTLQMIAYISDCYQGKTQAQKNPLKYLLFISFFPQIIQGPIPRYKELSIQLYERHRFEYENLTRGMLKIVWGFFLKLMIADKAAVFVNNVFNGNNYVGGYIIIGVILYAVQLYTDFYSCTAISQGVARLFGVKLSNNFCRPYFAVSIKDFWRRWHISLSMWLKDYIYIPFGGSRKGKVRKYINIVIVFLISGVWHGSQYQFIVWGLMHAVYQIVGDLSYPEKERIYGFLKIHKGSPTYNLIKRFGVFFWVMIGWIFFRSKDIAQGIEILKNAFIYINPWSIWGTELFLLGLDNYDFSILLISITVLILIEFKQERGFDLQEWFVKQHLILRWSILFIMIIVIWVFGTYGYEFITNDFIYGGF